MNKYHVVFYFSDKINYETYVNSKLDMKKFTDEMSEKFNAKNNIFVNFIGEDIKYCINKNNVLFYTIELTPKGITKEVQGLYQQMKCLKS